MELPVRKLLLGADAAKVANPDAMADTHSIDFFVQFRARIPTAERAHEVHAGAGFPDAATGPLRAWPMPRCDAAYAGTWRRWT